MACKPTLCKVCNKPFPACQLRNGICPGCRAEIAKKEAQSVQAPEQKK